MTRNEVLIPMAETSSNGVRTKALRKRYEYRHCYNLDYAIDASSDKPVGGIYATDHRIGLLDIENRSGIYVSLTDMKIYQG